MPATQTIVYDKWDGGEFGTMGPSQAPAGTWTGTNAVVYRSGYIGPRPGLHNLNLSIPSQGAGPLVGLGYFPTGSATDKKNWFIVGDRVMSFRTDSTGVTLCTTVLGAANDSDHFANGKESVRHIGTAALFTTNSGIYSFDPSLGTGAVVSEATDTPYGTDIELYRDRFVRTAAGTVYYSDPSDLSYWPPYAYIQVGYGWNCIAAFVLRDSLVLFMQDGTWTISGSLGSSGVLRKTSDTLPPGGKLAIVRSNDEIIYIPGSRSAPVLYNGSYGDELALKHLESWASAGSTAYGIQSYGNRDVVFTSSQIGNYGLWRKNYIWTKHDFGSIEVGPMARNADDEIVIGTVTGAGVKPTFYVLDCDLDRPAFTSDASADPGDDSDSVPIRAEVTLPDYLDPQGDDLIVRQVIVDFIKYNTGSSANNELELTVTPIARFGLPDDGTPLTGDGTNGLLFSEAGSAATTTGTPDRLVFNGGLQGYAAGYRLKLEMQGVTVKKVTVKVEPRPSTPRY